MDYWKTLVETSSDEMVMIAVWALWEFSLFDRQQNRSDQSLTALDNALMRLYTKMFACHDQGLWKAVKAKVNNLLQREAHQLHEQNINEICAVMDDQVYRVESVETRKQSLF